MLEIIHISMHLLNATIYGPSKNRGRHEAIVSAGLVQSPYTVTISEGAQTHTLHVTK